MVENNRNKAYGIASAVMFIIFAIMGFSNFIRWWHFNDLIFCAGNALIASGILLKNKDKLVACGVVVILAVEVITFFENFYYSNYDIWDYYYTHFNFFCMLPNLIKLAAVFGMTAVVLSIFTNKLDKYSNQISKFWFIPLILRGIAFVTAIVVMLASNGNWVYSYGWISIRNFFAETLSIVSFVLLIMWSGEDLVKSDFQYKEVNSDNACSGTEGGCFASTQPEGWVERGYIGMTKHVLLLVFTFGVWNLIWIYKTTAYLSHIETMNKKSPVAQLLLCIFVPFYMIYWIYDSSKRIDYLAKENGVSSDITLVSTLFAIFFYIFAPVFMQDKINDIIRMRDDRRTFNRSVGEEQQSYYSYRETTVADEEQPSESYTKSEPAESSTESPSYGSYTYAMNNDDVLNYNHSPGSEHSDMPEQNSVAEQSEEPSERGVSASNQDSKSASDIAEELKIYKDLMDKGIITQEEFNQKKKQILEL